MTEFGGLTPPPVHAEMFGMDLEPLDLRSDSDVNCSFHRLAALAREFVLFVRFEGQYRDGCRGNGDAVWMEAMGAAGLTAFDPSAVIIDLSGLDYEWGDMLERVLDLDLLRRIPSAIVLGPGCRQAVGTLLVDLGRTTDPADPCACSNVFDTLEAAADHVLRRLEG